MRYELSDGEWATIRPMLPNKARGVPRVDTATDRRLSPRSGIGGASLARCSRRTPAEGSKSPQTLRVLKHPGSLFPVAKVTTSAFERDFTLLVARVKALRRAFV